VFGFSLDYILILPFFTLECSSATTRASAQQQEKLKTQDKKEGRKQKSSSGGKSSFHSFRYVHRQGIKIFNQKSNLRIFSSLFHNPVNLI
jgi:uncharacterized membrane protein